MTCGFSSAGVRQSMWYFCFKLVRQPFPYRRPHWCATDPFFSISLQLGALHSPCRQCNSFFSGFGRYGTSITNSRRLWWVPADCTKHHCRATSQK